MRLVRDSIAYCAEHLPQWNAISISGYHIREAGATAVQELAFTLYDGLTYVQEAVEAGLSIDAFAPRLSFFFDVHSDFFEEIAKFRAARRYGRGKSNSAIIPATRARCSCGPMPRPLGSP